MSPRVHPIATPDVYESRTVVSHQQRGVGLLPTQNERDARLHAPEWQPANQISWVFVSNPKSFGWRFGHTDGQGIRLQVAFFEDV